MEPSGAGSADSPHGGPCSPAASTSVRMPSAGQDGNRSKIRYRGDPWRHPAVLWGRAMPASECPAREPRKAKAPCLLSCGAAEVCASECAYLPSFLLREWQVSLPSCCTEEGPSVCYRKGACVAIFSNSPRLKSQRALPV